MRINAAVCWLGLALDPFDRDRVDASAWRTETTASEVHAQHSSLRAGRSAQQAQAGAASHADYDLTPQSDIDAGVARAQQQAQQAQAEVARVEQLTQQAEQSAADAATAAAKQVVAELEADSAAYYASLEQELRDKAIVKVDPKADAAQKAAKPYVDAQLAAMNMVAQYQAKSQALNADAVAAASYAKQLATQANQYQRFGDSVMAARKMIQAHGLTGTANIKEGQAKQVWKFARELNQAIPNYQNAAAAAAAAVMAR